MRVLAHLERLASLLRPHRLKGELYNRLKPL
jgi:hypothetical protein